MTDDSAKNPWIENTGTIPDGVGPDTVIEVEYRCGHTLKDTMWDVGSFWKITNDSADIIRWRFV